MRDDDLLYRRSCIEADTHELAVDENVVGVGNCRADKHGVGCLIDADIDEINAPLMAVDASIREADGHLYAAHVAAAAIAILAGLQELALADREEDVHRVLTDNGCQDAAAGRDNVALRDVRPADPACNRRLDVGVAKIDFRRFQVCFAGQDGGGGVLVGGQRLIALLRRPIGRGQELVGPFEFDHRELFRRLASRKCAFGLFHRGFKQALLDAIEGLPLFHQIPFLEQDRFQIAGDAGCHRHALHGLDAAGEAHCLCNRLHPGDHG